MSALHPEALKAARAVLPGNPMAVEKVVAAYLAVAFPQSGSPEESNRFIGRDGTPMVSVLVARSLPFAKALIYEWSLLDGKDRDWMLKQFKSISIEAATYDAILDRVRLRLRPGAPAGGGQ